MSNIIEVRTKGAYKSLFTKAPIKKGETLIELTGNLTTQATRYSLQLDNTLHLDVPATEVNKPTGQYLWIFLNHSCVPNARMDVKNRRLVALTDIGHDTEINYNYNTTEYELAEPFECICNDKKVMIRGYKYLSPEEKELLSPYVASHLRV